MHYVYLLKSEKNGSLYVGCTNNVVQRLKEHNKDMGYHTSKYSPWTLIYLEGYRSQSDAYSREKSLKRYAQGLRRIKERLRDSLRA